MPAVSAEGAHTAGVERLQVVLQQVGILLQKGHGPAQHS